MTVIYKKLKDSENKETWKDGGKGAGEGKEESR